MSKATNTVPVKGPIARALKGLPLDTQIHVLQELGFSVGLSANFADATVLLAHGTTQHEASGHTVSEAMDRALTCCERGYEWMRIDGSTPKPARTRVVLRGARKAVQS